MAAAATTTTEAAEATPGPRSTPSRCRRRAGRARRDVFRPRRREGGGGAARAEPEAAAAAAGAVGAPRGDLKGPWPRRGGAAGGRSRSRSRAGGGAEEEPGGSGAARGFFRRSLAAHPPQCRRGGFFRVTQPHHRGMEKHLASFSEHQGDGGSRSLLMPPEATQETFPALECPQGEERRAAFLQDGKKALENSALSTTTMETELEEDAFYTADDLTMRSRDGKGPSGPKLRPLQEDPDFFSSLSRQEPDVALEAHDVADEPGPALSGAVSASAPRTDLGSTNDERLDFQKGLYRAEVRSSVDLRSVATAAEWTPSAGSDESTLERFSTLRDSKDARGVKESTFLVEPHGGNAIRVEPESDAEEMDGGEGGAGTSLGAGEEPYLPKEPKQLEGLHREHLEKSKRGLQRFEWVPRPTRSPSPPYKDVTKPTDVATASPFRGHVGREVPPPLTPTVFRKTLNPVLPKAKGLESSSSLRKGLMVEADLGEIDALAAAEWTIQKPSLQLSGDLAVGKQSWTVNAEDSVERIPLMALEAAPCSSYDVEVRPYVCGVVVEEQSKEEVGPDDDPSVYTCIECSIYFKKKDHLMDHMLQHNRGAGGDQDGDALGGQCQFCCNECGWAFGDPTALEQHKRLHQESREKIIEEIQKLNEFPDEGRDARLQCPKCVFGTNSSKIFVQHAKMHVKERKDQGAKNLNLFGSGTGGELRDDATTHGIYKPFQTNEPPPGTAKALLTCVLCGFPAPNNDILKEHMRYAHSHLNWDAEGYEDDPNQPGTSRDAYSPARSGRFAEVEYFGKAERFFPPPHRESVSHYETIAGFGPTSPRLPRSNGAGRKDHHGSGFPGRKAAPYVAPPKALGFSSSKASSHVALQQLKKKTGGQRLEGEGDGLGNQPVGLEELRHKWALANDVGNVEEEISISTEIDLSEKRSGKAVAVPQAALDLKRTFRDTLKATDSSIATEEQRQQLRMMVPLVLLEEMSLHPKAKKRPRKLFKKKTVFPPRDFMLEEPLPLDVLLLDAPLEGTLDLDDFLDSDSPMLKNEERKCPYCPDRFHNGIGLANHVRGHLNRVGVSYNVRHFISAEEVKAIEQKFSFQKKKKKVANFDPSTFSLMRCEFCGAGFDTRAGLSSHARAHLRDFGITNWELTISPINILKELLANSSEHPLVQAALAMEPSSPGREREPHGLVTPKSVVSGAEGGVPRSPLSPFPTAWVDESLQVYRDVLAPEEDDLVAMEVGSPPLPKKSAPPPAQLEPPPARMGTKLSPEPPGSKPEPQDAKAQNLTTCEVCGACFETRKGLSSHARSHLRQLGVAESESSGAPIDLLYELMKQKVKPDGSSLTPVLGKKSGSPKDATASPRPTLLALGKAADRLSDGPINKAIKSPPGFSKSLSQPGSPILKKVPPTLSGSPSPKNPEEKSSKLSLSPLPSSPKAPWPPVDDEGPLNLTSGSEPVRDIRCEFCGEFFENRKGLSSHARSHLRQMGVTEWYVNGSPIDTLREILKRRTQPRSGTSNPTGPGKAMAKSLLGSMGSLEPRGPGELHIPTLSKKVQQPGSPLGHSPTSSPPPTARKMFPGLSPPSLQKKLKQDHLRLEIKREMMAGGLHGEPHPSDCTWPPREEMSPLNLSSRADPVRDIRCEFCGEFFENRKGLSSHARSHLRQMGVTEWSVNGSPIDTLREILKKKTKPCVIKKEPHLSSIEPPKSIGEEGTDPKSPGKILQGMALTPLGGRPGKPSAGTSALSREISLSPLTTKAQGGFLAPLATKRPLPEDRLGPHGEIKHKSYIQTELAFKSKTVHEKPAHTSSEACCELCGLYFENRKALASHARAHLRQFGVTEWCVNGSPIETLSEWIRHRPQKAGAYRSYIQGGRPFTKKFRNSGHAGGARRMPLSLQAGSVAFLSKGLPGELAHGDAGKLLDGGSGGERPMITSPLSLVKMEEHQRSNINKFERRQARPLDPPLHREEEGAEFQQKLEAARQPPPRVRPVPSLVPRPPRTSLVKFVGNIYTLKCRFCEVEFQGPLSIQEEWVWHLQRHILEMNFSKADPLRSDAAPAAPEPPALAEAQ
ncbi:protein Wiz isoform X3 [Cuculus canorus]|uniref:protein Wiz isoform X3 n=1 Tax=Cuculus canorus TaxID=55661 RepID=UPI0023AB12EE|nr:protein Wiz isoform X3 [Cuculus canorus]